MCVNGGDEGADRQALCRAEGAALVALLIYLGPLLRGWERIKWRVHETRAQPHAAPATTEQKARCVLARSRLSPRLLERGGGRKGGADRRADAIFWSRKNTLSCLTPGGAAGILKIARGLCSRALVLVCAENIMAAKSGCCGCAARCGCRGSRLSCCAAMLLMTAFALLLGWPVAAAVLTVAGLVNLARDRDQARRFRRVDASHHRGRRQTAWD